MAAPTKFQHSLYPDSTITLALFIGLETCKELRKCVMNGTLEASLLKTEMVVDAFQVLVAANKAVHLNHTNSMTTKTVHSEILFCLSPSKNISESFRTCGISDSDTSVFVAIVDDEDNSTLAKITELLGTRSVPLDRVSSITDSELVTKAYKLTSEELSSFTLLDAVISRISAKEIITAGKGKK